MHSTVARTMPRSTTGKNAALLRTALGAIPERLDHLSTHVCRTQVLYLTSCDFSTGISFSRTDAPIQAACIAALNTVSQSAPPPNENDEHTHLIGSTESVFGTRSGIVAKLHYLQQVSIVLDQ